MKIKIGEMIINEEISLSDIKLDIIKENNLGELLGIEITNLPHNLEYIEGEKIDLTGLEVKAYYSNDNIVATITDKCKIIVSDPLSEQDNKVLIQYENMEISYPIKVRGIYEAPSSTIILMHLDGDNRNEITDNNSGMPSLSATYDPKFGTKSARAAFTISNYTGVPTYTELVNGEVELTVSFWAYLQATKSKAIFEIMWGSGNNDIIKISQYNTSFLKIGVVSPNDSGSNVYQETIIEAPKDIINVWMHFGVVIKSGYLTVYYDGVKTYNHQIFSRGSGYASNEDKIVRLKFGETDTSVMRVDEILVCKEALYAEDFIPPTEPYIVKGDE